MDKHNKYVVLTIALVVAVSVCVSVYFVITILQASKDSTGENTTSSISQPCSDQQATTIIKDTSTALDPERPENSNELTAIANKIFEYENYQSDAYCLHILTTKYVYDSDYQNAKKYFSLLEKNMSDSGTKELVRKLNFLTVDELRKNVEFLGRKIEEIEANDPYGSAL